MKKFRDVVVLLALGAAFGVSLAMFRQAVGVASPWFGLLLMMVFLGLAAFARPLIALRLPRVLRTNFDWEKSGRLYKALGVPAFGELLRRTLLRNLNPLVYLSENSSTSVVQAQLEAAELAHLIAAAVLLPYLARAFVERQWAALALLGFVQIGGNIYPIFHLRWARVRISRVYRRGRQAAGVSLADRGGNR